MINSEYLPSSVAQELNQSQKITKELNYTYTGTADEKKLYNEINNRLNLLEKDLTMGTMELETINSMASEFKLAVDEKNEVFLRIEWLRRMYKVKEDIKAIDTKESATRIRRSLAPIHTCPFKNDLLSLLVSLEESLPSEENESVQLTGVEALMSKALEEAGDSFINLGKVGRDSVIRDVFNQFGKKATIEAVQEHTKALEQRVDTLTAIKESKELIKQLDNLPIPSFHALSTERKGRIAETLLENSKWNGSASLDRMIAHLDKGITNEEQQLEEAKNTILTLDDKAALTLDIKNVEDGRVQLS